MRIEDLAEVRRTRWKAGGELSVSPTLAPSEARGPILGLVFLAYGRDGEVQSAGALPGLAE